MWRRVSVILNMLSSVLFRASLQTTYIENASEILSGGIE